MKSDVDEICQLCVYMPSNLPVSAYSTEDYRMLQAKDCAYDFVPGSDECSEMRKTSCSIVDMKAMTRELKSE